MFGKSPYIQCSDVCSATIPGDACFQATYAAGIGRELLDDPTTKARVTTSVRLRGLTKQGSTDPGEYEYTMLFPKGITREEPQAAVSFRSPCTASKALCCLDGISAGLQLYWSNTITYDLIPYIGVGNYRIHMQPNPVPLKAP